MCTHFARYVFIVSVFASGLLGQVERANLTGTVSDPSGAAVSGATVAVSYPDTGFKRTVQTGASGNYSIPALPLGICKLTVEAQGFQTQQVDNLALGVGDTRTLNFTLALKTVVDSIQVNASDVVLEQATAETGGVVGSQQVEQLPLNGRNWATLMLLVPGAVNTGIGNQTGIRFAGHGLDDNKLVFDGTDATGILRQSQKTDLRLQISSEAIAEFRVNSSLYSAEFGGVAGGQGDAGSLASMCARTASAKYSSTDDAA